MQLPPWQRPGMAWHSSTSTGRRAKTLESAAIATDACWVLAWRECYEKEEALLQVGGFTFHNAITHQITLEIRWRTEKGHKGIAGLSTQARGRPKYSNIFQSKHHCVYAPVVCSRLVAELERRIGLVGHPPAAFREQHLLQGREVNLWTVRFCSSALSQEGLSCSHGLLIDEVTLCFPKHLRKASVLAARTSMLMCCRYYLYSSSACSNSEWQIH